MKYNSVIQCDLLLRIITKDYFKDLFCKIRIGKE